MHTWDQLRQNIVGSGSILAVVTGLGYVCALLFEIGYLNFYGISYQAARATTDSFILFGMCILLVGAVLSHSPNLLRLIFMQPAINDRPLAGLLFLRFKEFIVLCALVQPIGVYYGRGMHTFLILCAYIVFTTILALLLEWDAKGFRNKLLGAVKRSEANFHNDGGHLSVVSLLVVGLCGLSLLMGKTFALTRHSYQLVGEDKVIVRQYGDTIIVAGYDQKRGKLSGGYEYLKINEKGITFRTINVDNLKP